MIILADSGVGAARIWRVETFRSLVLRVDEGVIGAVTFESLRIACESAKSQLGLDAMNSATMLRE